MTFNYWTSFSKKENSTARPSGSGTAVTGFLKEPTNVMKPTIILAGHVSVTHNYWQIPDFNRYYKVSEMRYVGPRTEIDLTVDVLATYKSDIGSYVGLIARSSDPLFTNHLIADPIRKDSGEFKEYLSSGAITVFGSTPARNIFDEDYYTYVLSVVGKPATTGTARSFATFWALTPTQMADLATAFNDPGTLQNLIQEFANPMDCIVGCIRLPININNFTGVTEHIFFGSYDSQVSGLRLTAYRIEGHNNISLNAGAYSINKTYQNTPPYSTYSLYLPFVGCVSLDYQAIWENWALNLWTYVDLTTGDVVYKVLNGDDTSVFATFSGNCASDVPISNQRQATTKSLAAIGLTIGGVVATIATAGTAGPAAALLTGGAAAASAVGTAIAGLEVHTQTSGSISSAMAAKLGVDVVISIYKKIIGSVVDSEEGLPVYASGKPSDHVGFCKFVAASISIPGFSEEASEINDHLNGGFFYE